jgi:hypothetical protein
MNLRTIVYQYHHLSRLYFSTLDLCIHRKLMLKLQRGFVFYFASLAALFLLDASFLLDCHLLSGELLLAGLHAGLSCYASLN